MEYSPTSYSVDIWVRNERDEEEYLIGYSYMGCHTDNLMIVAEDTQTIMEQPTAVYMVAKPGPPSYHFEDGRDFWFMSSESHTKEAIVKAEKILEISGDWN